MNHDNKQISEIEARSALNSIKIAEEGVSKSLRPPLWLNLIISGSYGVMTFSWASTRHENQWMLGVFLSSLVFFIGVIFYLYSSRLLGIKPKLVPSSSNEFFFTLFVALVLSAVFFFARFSSTNGFWWGALIGGVINAAIMVYLLYTQMTGNRFGEKK